MIVFISYKAFDFEGSAILIEIIFIISIQKVSLYNMFLSSGFLQWKWKDLRFNLKRTPFVLIPEITLFLFIEMRDDLKKQDHIYIYF